MQSVARCLVWGSRGSGHHIEELFATSVLMSWHQNFSQLAHGSQTFTSPTLINKRLFLFHSWDKPISSQKIPRIALLLNLPTTSLCQKTSKSLTSTVDSSVDSAFPLAVASTAASFDLLMVFNLAFASSQHKNNLTSTDSNLSGVHPAIPPQGLALTQHSSCIKDRRQRD